MLAEHYIFSKNYEKGADYSKLAEKKAEKTASINDAVVYAKNRISCLEKLPVDDDVEKKIIDARTVLGLYYTQLGLPLEAKAAVDPIVDLAIKRNYKRRVSQINVILGLYYYAVNEDYPKALEYYERAINVGEELNDLLTLILANDQMGFCLSDNGEFEKALSSYEKSLRITVMANVQWGIVGIKTDIINWVYGRQGKVELAYRTSQEALKISDESGDIFSKGHAHLALGLSYYLKGCLEEAEDHLLKSVDFLQKSDQLAFAASANTLGHTPDIQVMDAENMSFDSEQFDCVLLHLLLAVVPDPFACAKEVVRVLKPGGRVSIFDKFLPDGTSPSIFRHVLNLITNTFFSNINRHLGPILQQAELEPQYQEPSVFGGPLISQLHQKINQVEKRSGSFPPA